MWFTDNSTHVFPVNRWQIKETGRVVLVMNKLRTLPWTLKQSKIQQCFCFFFCWKQKRNWEMEMCWHSRESVLCTEHHSKLWKQKIPNCKRKSQICYTNVFPLIAFFEVLRAKLSWIAWLRTQDQQWKWVELLRGLLISISQKKFLSVPTPGIRSEEHPYWLQRIPQRPLFVFSYLD